MLYYCRREQWNINHVFALLCGVADWPSVYIFASLRRLHPDTQQYVTLLCLSWKFYELLTRYYGYSVRTLYYVCGESRDLSSARSVTQEIRTSKLRADSLSTIHVKTDRPSRWVAIWDILGSLIKLWLQSSKQYFRRTMFKAYWFLSCSVVSWISRGRPHIFGGRLKF
jgi:hypothetical protein